MPLSKEQNDIYRKASYIEGLAYKAVVREVQATPKPGLVDRKDNGAHDDMDYALFVDSANAIRKTFYRCAEVGLTWQSEDGTALFNELRRIGIRGEQEMFLATQGVNTHKGMLFSMCIVCGAVGWMYRDSHLAMNRQNLSKRIMLICKDLMLKDFQGLDAKDHLTKGEQLYLSHKITGIRGEASGGYQSVVLHSLPFLEEMLARGLSVNDALVNTLIKLMTVTEDSNIAGRHNLQVLEDIKAWADHIIDLGGMESSLGSQEILAMNEQFIERRISPGGSADLLAVTMMFYMLEKGEL